MFYSPEQVARRYYELFNERRFEETERLVHAEALFHYPELGHELIGPAAHRALSQIWLTAFPDLRLDPTGMRVKKDGTVHVDVVARGTHLGALRLGAVALDATQSPVTMPFQHTLKIARGKITDLTLHLDVPRLLRQLEPPAR